MRSASAAELETKFSSVDAIFFLWVTAGLPRGLRTVVCLEVVAGMGVGVDVMAVVGPAVGGGVAWCVIRADVSSQRSGSYLVSVFVIQCQDVKEHTVISGDAGVDGHSSVGSTPFVASNTASASPTWSCPASEFPTPMGL